ncbi:MAG: flagellar basal body P-ring formation protein FlgA [Planctomycetales bacterium]|nr:flagellar basal body P-ring formation protein FlgA [bacterium]UNM07295.1 MAG: flagellar basal body P-ring formation protein FlgA [Planctomycetales bacterium]
MPERLIIIAAVFIATGLCLSGKAMAAELLRLEIAETVELDGNAYTVSDVVLSHSGREDFWNAISGEQLGKLRGNGQAILSTQTLLATLASRGYDWRLIGIEGAVAVRISRLGDTISAARMSDFIESQSSADLGVPVELINLPDVELADLKLSQTGCTLELRYPQNKTRSLPEALQVRHDGNVVETIVLTRYFRFRLPVVRSIAQIARDALIDDSLLASEMEEVRPGVAVVTDPADVAGLESTRSIAAGSLMDMDMLREPWHVHKREAITILMNAGGLSCSAAGEAMADGRIGEVITVKRLEDGEKFLGTIIAAGKVEIR